MSSNVTLVESDDIAFTKGALVFPCGGGTALEVYSVVWFFVVR